MGRVGYPIQKKKIEPGRSTLEGGLVSRNALVVERNARAQGDASGSNKRLELDNPMKTHAQIKPTDECERTQTRTCTD